ncbi:ATP-dependent nuclease [Eoetvoesiella caeni]|uniref:Putative ATP-dependent endonuclease of OLD family n=1 Tax=Eoetvoesiella caeni TaxID=645616 RepID=A0A366HDL4_9BURK|nr:AAA family ATPase [Eoetvoesiella caeni]MCI2808937.1 AAA family ATPase [Eoetvoesiella caeni]NYT55562.1 AAA family ATPase [Eoetvoesiella caeni]RBP40117.1 putative ATP-dependent endonuclease of OLD family [Eoetvoesiella caeni]
MIVQVKIEGYRIHKSLVVVPNRRFNLLVGANESGKSTLMEAVALALTGRINGRSASEELNPHWFNTDLVDDFIRKRKAGTPAAFPEILIELSFEDIPELQSLCGAVNTYVPTRACPGVTMKVSINSEYADELEAWARDPTPLLPVEYYKCEWRTFADKEITSRPKALATAIIDSRTVRATSGIDYHLRQILGDHLQPAERAAISLEYRKVKASMSQTALSSVNTRMKSVHATLHDQPIELAMDQSARTSWEGVVTPHVESVPFSMSGQGQQSAIKISLAMNRNAERAQFVMVEEPENHLTHTSLVTLLGRMESLAGEQQQLFITTHSSFVLNRLGLDALILMGKDTAAKLTELDPETVAYFKKLPGYDTLRIVLAKKIVLVEGPSDEIVFERVFRDVHGKPPMQCGIDVLSMRGLSLARGLELCAALNKSVSTLRDNDGIEPADLRSPVEKWLKAGARELFIGEVADGKTLEPQLIKHCGEPLLREILGITPAADLLTWMTREKTEAALRISETTKKIVPPPYILDAVKFAHG